MTFVRSPFVCSFVRSFVVRRSSFVCSLFVVRRSVVCCSTAVNFIHSSFTGHTVRTALASYLLVTHTLLFGWWCGGDVVSPSLLWAVFLMCRRWLYWTCSWW